MAIFAVTKVLRAAHCIYHHAIYTLHLNEQDMAQTVVCIVLFFKTC